MNVGTEKRGKLKNPEAVRVSARLEVLRLRLGHATQEKFGVAMGLSRTDANMVLNGRSLAATGKWLDAIVKVVGGDVKLEDARKYVRGEITVDALLSFRDREPPQPTVERTARYAHVEKLVKDAARTARKDRAPEEFIANWHMSAEQSALGPDFDEAYAVFKHDHNLWKLEQRGRTPLGVREATDSDDL